MRRGERGKGGRAAAETAPLLAPPMPLRSSCQRSEGIGKLFCVASSSCGFTGMIRRVAQAAPGEEMHGAGMEDQGRLAMAGTVAGKQFQFPRIGQRFD